MNLKFTGGPLQLGDFIAIAYSNHFVLGWFAGTGRGTIQYFHLSAPKQANETYASYINGKASPYYQRIFKNGFTIKSIWKGYINSPHGNRVVKLENPEAILDQDTLQQYQESKQVLIDIKFIKQ